MIDVVVSIFSLLVFLATVGVVTYLFAKLWIDTHC